MAGGTPDDLDKKLRYNDEQMGRNESTLDDLFPQAKYVLLPTNVMDNRAMYMSQ